MHRYTIITDILEEARDFISLSKMPDISNGTA